MPESGFARPATRRTSALPKLGRASWVRTGIELARIEAEQSWSGSASSFSEWLKNQATKLGVEESNLWRYLSAVRFYPELRQSLIDGGHDCPEVQNLSEQVSPENLELLSKLIRVMPPADFAPLAARVLDRSAKRDELRKLWQAYRPALAGKTARGKGVAAPAFDKNDPANRIKLVIAQARLLLEADPLAWLCQSDPAFTHVVHDFRLPEKSALHGNAGMDMVIAVKRTESAPLELHGIEIRLNLLSQTIPGIVDLAQSVNYLWVAFAKPYKAGLLASIPAHIGILNINDGSISVVRVAESTKARPESILATTQHFLYTALAR
jgi:hypothetical protein